MKKRTPSRIVCVRSVGSLMGLIQPYPDNENISSVYVELKGNYVKLAIINVWSTKAPPKKQGELLASSMSCVFANRISNHYGHRKSITRIIVIPLQVAVIFFQSFGNAFQSKTV